MDATAAATVRQLPVQHGRTRDGHGVQPESSHCKSIPST